MSNLMERYVHDVVRRLPEKEREEVKKELTANILDMLPDDYTESDVVHVLQDLGSPAKLAEQYRSKPRYLIFPASFDNYLMVLKIVVGVAVAVSIFVGLIDILTNLPAESTWSELFGMIWGSLFDSLFSMIGAAFVWVTIIFAIMDYANIKQGEVPWTVANLPEIPKKQVEMYPRVKLLISLIVKAFFSIFFIILLTAYPNLIAWYDTGKPVITIFNQSVLSDFIPFIILFMAISLAISAAKVFLGRWNLITTVAHCIFNIANAAFIIFFITAPNLFNSEIYARIAELSNTSIAEATNGWNAGVNGFVVFIAVITAVDIASELYKTYKHYSQKLV